MFEIRLTSDNIVNQSQKGSIPGLSQRICQIRQDIKRLAGELDYTTRNSKQSLQSIWEEFQAKAYT